MERNVEKYLNEFVAQGTMENWAEILKEYAKCIRGIYKYIHASMIYIYSLHLSQ